MFWSGKVVQCMQGQIIWIGLLGEKIYYEGNMPLLNSKVKG